MSTLKAQINEDFKAAFKAGETEKKNVLGFLKSKITLKEQEKGRASGEASDDEVLGIIKKSIKNCNETISQAGDNPVDSERFEITVLEAYLPAQMSEEEIDSKIKEVVEGGANNIGAIMGAFKGLNADKKLVSEKAREALSA